MSDINKDGGPAFARPLSKFSPEEVSCDQDGMTLRDYFAAAALQGLLASCDPALGNIAPSHAYGARHAYLWADAMLAERSKP